MPVATRIDARVIRLERAAPRTIPAPRARLLLAAVVGIIRRNVTDRDTLRRLADDVSQQAGDADDIGNGAVPAEVFTGAIRAVATALRRHVTDAETLARIDAEFARLAGTSPQ